MKPLPPGCILRRLNLTDEPALLEFFGSHSKETVFQRYHTFVAAMTHRRAFALLNVDQERDVALAVLEPGRDADRIHAIARYYTEPTGEVAEIAFVVRESMRRSGLATQLLFALAATARAHGLRWLRAQLLNENFAMQSVLRPYTSQIHRMPGADVVEYIVPVASLAVRHDGPCIHAGHATATSS